jgi:hypothetical protein
VTVYPFIEAEKQGRRNVKRACELLKVSRAAYYQHRAGPSGHQRADARLASQIQAVPEESQGRYGAPRIHAELRRRGHRHSRKRIARLMRTAKIRGRAPKRWRTTTIPGPGTARADQIRRGFTADASNLNTRWCGDITYISTWEGGCTWPPSSTSPPAGSSATRSPITCAPNWSAPPWPTPSPPVTPRPG